MLLEQLDDPADPGVARRGAAGEREVVSLHGRVDGQQPQPGGGSRGQPRHQRDADAGGDELELHGVVGRLGDDVRLKAGGAAARITISAQVSSACGTTQSLVRLVGQPGGTRRGRRRRGARRHGEQHVLRDDAGGEQPLAREPGTFE